MRLTPQPRVFAVAGGPASGKSTFVKAQLKAGVFPADAFLHDCDGVMEGLQGYQDDVKQLGAAEAFRKWELVARQLAEEQLAQAAALRRDIIYDRSCALLSSFEFLERLVNEAGYQLFFYYLALDPEVALARARSREQETGRHTPPGMLAGRSSAIFQLLPQYRALATQSFMLNVTLVSKEDERG